MPIPFPPLAGGRILGQPFAVSNLSIPVNVTLTCNCALPPSELQVIASAPVQCQACRKTYIVTLNPANGQVLVAVGVEQPQVIS